MSSIANTNRFTYFNSMHNIKFSFAFRNAVRQPTASRFYEPFLSSVNTARHTDPRIRMMGYRENGETNPFLMYMSHVENRKWWDSLMERWLEPVKHKKDKNTTFLTIFFQNIIKITTNVWLFVYFFNYVWSIYFRGSVRPAN